MTSRKRFGFTLPEVLVTIAIIATLAAVLLPALTGQISKGDATRAAEDLKAVQTAITAFVSDVRRYPGKLEHLTESVSTSDVDALSSTYPEGLVAKWNGPYLNKQLETNGTLKTTFGAYIQSSFSDTLVVSSTYLAVRFEPISTGDFAKLDALIDDTANSSTGLLRLNSSSTATFFAVPVQ